MENEQKLQAMFLKFLMESDAEFQVNDANKAAKMVNDMAQNDPDKLKRKFAEFMQFMGISPEDLRKEIGMKEEEPKSEVKRNVAETESHDGKPTIMRNGGKLNYLKRYKRSL